MSKRHFELGLNSFGDVASDGGRMLSDAPTIRLHIEEVQRAERVGLDIFSVGEHYRDARAQTIEPLGREMAPMVDDLLMKEALHA